MGATALWISDKSSLQDLSGLGALTEAHGDAIIQNNSALQSMAGLERLEHIKGGYPVGSLHVSSNPVLATLAGLDALTKVDNSLVITNNPMLPACEAVALKNRRKTPCLSSPGNDDAVCP